MKANIYYENTLLEKLPQFKINDNGMKIYFYIIDENNSVINLTDYSVKFVAKKIDYTIVDKYLIDSACTVSSATNGICYYSISSSDLVEEGTFDCYLKVYKTGFEQKIPLGYLNIYDK